MRGQVKSAEHRKKLSKSLKGRSHSPESIEKRKATIKKNNKPRPKHSPETIEKIRKSQLGKKISTVAKEKLRQSNLGKKMSEETKEKLRIKMIEIRRLKREGQKQNGVD